jgi:hypothetical protein
MAAQADEKIVDILLNLFNNRLHNNLFVVENTKAAKRVRRWKFISGDVDFGHVFRCPQGQCVHSHGPKSQVMHEYIRPNVVVLPSRGLLILQVYMTKKPRDAKNTELIIKITSKDSSLQ